MEDIICKSDCVLGDIICHLTYNKCMYNTRIMDKYFPDLLKIVADCNNDNEKIIFILAERGFNLVDAGYLNYEELIANE